MLPTTLFSLLVTIAALGFLSWLVTTYVPMMEPFATLFRVVVVIVIILFVLKYVSVF